MSARPGLLAAIRILLPRAAGSYLLLRLLLTLLAAFLRDGAEAGASEALTNPIGIALIAGALGFADVRRRGERLLWANLGYPPVAVPALFAATAIAGETLLLLLPW